jgi:hypothetical protein
MGWTLQELLAPNNALLFDAFWSTIELKGFTTE